MSVRVLYFARSRELMGRSEEEIQLANVEQHLRAAATTAATAEASSPSAASRAVRVCDLLAFLVHSHPALAPLVPCTLLALNQEFVQPSSDAPLSKGDELAFIQPISGG
jgi:molybdopterin converting factor small subunit